MKKKISKLLLSFIMVFTMSLSFMPTTVLAENSEVLVSTNKELGTAIKNVTNGQTIKVTSDIAAGSFIINKPNVEFTLDLGGHTVSFESQFGKFTVDAGSMNVKNGTIVSAGIGIWFCSPGTLTIENATIESTSTTSGAIVMWNENCVVTLNSGSIIKANSNISDISGAIQDSKGGKLIVKAGVTVENTESEQHAINGQETSIYEIDSTATITGKIYPTKAEKYTITVNNGVSEKAEYEKDETVTIEADAPTTGKQFKEWTVVFGDIVLDDPTSATTTFNMPESVVEVTATYEDIPKEIALIFSPNGGTDTFELNAKPINEKYQDYDEYVLTELTKGRAFESKWSVASGSLPTGMSLKGASSHASLVGTPTAKGTYSFTLSVSDSKSPTDVYTTKEFKIVVEEKNIIKDTASSNSDHSTLAICAFFLLMSGCAVGLVTSKRNKHFNK